VLDYSPSNDCEFGQLPRRSGRLAAVPSSSCFTSLLGALIRAAELAELLPLHDIRLKAIVDFFNLIDAQACTLLPGWKGEWG